MAHQALDALKYRANRNSNNDAQLDPWTAALLGGKGQGKGQQKQQTNNDDVVKRLSFLIENCGDVRRNRGLAWYSDSKAEVLQGTPTIVAQRQDCTSVVTCRCKLCKITESWQSVTKDHDTVDQ